MIKVFFELIDRLFNIKYIFYKRVWEFCISGFFIKMISCVISFGFKIKEFKVVRWISREFRSGWINVFWGFKFKRSLYVFFIVGIFRELWCFLLVVLKLLFRVLDEVNIVLMVLMRKVVFLYWL